MSQGRPASFRDRLTAPFRWAVNRARRGRRQPPAAGVREPRRPKPTLPAAAVALAEPRAGTRRWIKLTSRRPRDRG